MDQGMFQTEIKVGGGFGKSGTDLTKEGYVFSDGAHFASIFHSTVADGTIPLEITSKTLCPNLNVNFLQGYTAAELMGGGGYTLPIASGSVLGGIKVGARLSIDGSGILGAADQTYTLPTATGAVLGGVMIGSRLTMTAGVLSADVQTGTYSLPTADGSTLGGVKVGSRLTMTAGVLSADVQTSGLVSSVSGTAPVVSSGTTTPTISMAAATASVNGYMTSTYASKLDGIAAGANLYVHPNHSGNVTSVADGATTIAAGVVTLAMQANLAANSIMGNNTGSAATPLALTAAQVKTLLAIAQADVSGLTTGSSPTFTGLTVSGMTTGSVLFAGASGVLAQDNANFFWDNTNKRLGLGRTDPSAMLHVKGAQWGGGTASGQLVVQSNAAYNASPQAGIVFENTHTAGSQAIMGGIRVGKTNTSDGDYSGFIAFDVRKTGAVAFEAMRIDQDGNVGIGTTSPNFDGNTGRFLAVEGGIGTFAEIGVGGSNSGVNANLGTFSFYNSFLGTADKRNALILGCNDGATNSGNLAFYTTNAGSLSEKWRITCTGILIYGWSPGTYDLSGALGKIGISVPPGTGSPASETVSLLDSGDNGRGGSIRLYHDGSGRVDLNLSTRSGSTYTDVLTVRNTGNVGIGTTVPISLLSVGSSSQFQVNSSGLPVSSNAIPLQGQGYPLVVDTDSYTGRTTAIGSTNFTNANVAGLYRVSIYLATTTINVAAGVLTLTISYSDGSAIAKGYDIVLSSVLSGYRMVDTLFVRLATGSISYQTTVDVNGFGSPPAQYMLHLVCERIAN